jgi:hypothetical protein
MELWMIEQNGEPMKSGAFRTEAEAAKGLESLVSFSGFDRDTLSIEHYTGDKAEAYASEL